MIRQFIFALMIWIPLTAWAQAPAPNDTPADFPIIRFSMNPFYSSTGFYLGHVLNVRRVRPILSTFEGEMMIGFGSNPRPVVDRRCVQAYVAAQKEGTPAENQLAGEQECALFPNPWKFSFLSSALRDTIAEIKERPVVVFYTHHFWVPSHLLTKTNFLAQGAFKVNPNLNLPSSFRVPAWSRIHPEAGSITGRIVKASMENSLIKSYEVIIQESENSDNFRAMSVNDGALFRYITQAMLTGKKMRIEYIRLYRPHSWFLSTILNYATQYRVISVNLLND